MDYLNVNKAFRTLLLVLGFLSLCYGVLDLRSEEASRKGLNANRSEQPISYWFTVGKKVSLGSVLIFISLSPLLGRKK